MPTICLNMIVKDESDVIQRCLDSVKPYIDSWVIADTGSTDSTPQLIIDKLKDLPGQLLATPWIDFASNRNIVLDQSAGLSDYILFIDADERLTAGFNKHRLEKDYYTIKAFGRTSEFSKMFLVKNNPSWRWKGIVHESISHPGSATGELLQATSLIYDEVQGNRSRDPDKFHKDAALLEQALLTDPYNPRNLFYLAQSYVHAREYTKALQTYKERAELGGSPDEIYWSLYCIGCLEEDLGSPTEKVIAAYCKACQFDPSRAEPFYRLSIYLQKQPLLAYLLIKHASQYPFQESSAQSQKWIYDDVFPKLAEYAYSAGKDEESIQIHKELLGRDLTPEMRGEIEKNIRNIATRLSKKQVTPFFQQSVDSSRPL
ncbi:MAG: glycosyltransferase [Verrucomicrobia bacterium]|nr:glycosyltransferase [Verrucomicrobiota bacterium]